MSTKILIFDFGSQYTQLIARRIRELNIYCEIVPFNTTIADFSNIRGIILAGSPFSVRDENALQFPIHEHINRVPILGICYGMQLLARKFGGKVETRKIGEFGKTTIKIMDHSKLFENTDKEFNVWMSHKDVVIEAPNGFKVTSKTNNGIIASFENEEKKIYALQFHPEVKHTTFGETILKNFVIKICDINETWKLTDFVDEKIKQIRKKQN